MNRYFAILVLLPILAGAPSAAQDFKAGVDAFRKGDYATAVREWKPLAELGSVPAQFNLGLIFERGLGQPPDLVEATRWYALAAENGATAAQINLGYAYESGRGVERDFVQAHKWYQVAAERLPEGERRDKAVRNRDALATKMTTAEVDEALRLSRDWLKKWRQRRR